MVFIKTENRNCFSLNFPLRLDLVELDFSWNNTLMSCPIDFCCKRNKSPMWLRCSHLEMVKNMHSVSPLFKEQRTPRVSLPPISVHCPHSFPSADTRWQSSLQLKAMFTFGDNTCLEHHPGFPSIINSQITTLLLAGPVFLLFPSEAKAFFSFEMFWRC